MIDQLINRTKPANQFLNQSVVWLARVASNVIIYVTNTSLNTRFAKKILKWRELLHASKPRYRLTRLYHQDPLPLNPNYPFPPRSPDTRRCHKSTVTNVPSRLLTIQILDLPRTWCSLSITRRHYSSQPSAMLRFLILLQMMPSNRPFHLHR